MRFAVFLDVDGVLNTKTTCKHTPDGYTGIDDARVEILANAIKMYDCYEVILTSDWKEMRESDDDYIYLLEKLDLYGLYISGKTEDQGNNRGKGVIDYLKAHPEIDDLKKNISEWEVYGGTGILFTKAAETLQKFFRKIETMK